ncbi:hypothetical protein CORC01_04450 [Colletotrichum orchidophilum]|uniref:Tyrosinase copper-binding domain-containing protein n=1 Tax=Colletotrichum orchidophilum TaxID=1209926 RepID=A0A1G4BFW7_9PEZI|nr:uncharacterized protein CORC01_04450 [Colletotrichum orchidophilum]OHF00261.1 hypothetical protein CORC01_04450 [Colletotrichum orchidophilum]
MISTFKVVLGILVAAPWRVVTQEYPVVGVKSGVNMRTGEIPIRRNINNIYEEAGPQWDLYVGALTAMQDANETEPTSYFQVAGIHGQPYMAWSGGGPQSGAEAGYCPHNQGLFGTWHRGYLLLYEQLLVRYAKRAAASYPEPHKRAYVEAAESLRIAYWDWGADSQVPPITALPTVVIQKAVGGTLQPVAVRNPFYRFIYPKSAPDGDFGSFDGQNFTKRCVGDGESYPNTANAKLAGYNLKEKVYNVFVKATSFDEMVTAQNQGANFEGPHGEIHVGAACGQDLLHLSTSAFEPLFWLHHANVDRLIAFWQALHFENATMHFSYASSQMFATPSGTTVTPKYPLWPFIGTGGGPLTSEHVTHIRDWGYTYAPMRFWDQTPGDIKMAVSRTVNSLYGPQDQQSSSIRIKRRARIPRREYVAKVEVERSELELPCQVQLFLKGSLLGSLTLLDMPMDGKSYDEIPLNRGIETAGLGVLSTNGILGGIEDGLEVVISKLDGTTIPLDRVPSLKIEVEDQEIMPPDSLDELPTLGATRSRPAMPRPLSVES